MLEVPVVLLCSVKLPTDVLSPPVVFAFNTLYPIPVLLLALLLVNAKLPTAVHCPAAVPLAPTNALYPTDVFCVPVDPFNNAFVPTAVLNVPVVLYCMASYPNAVLSLTLLNCSAPLPTAVLLAPIVFKLNTLAPIPVLLLAV